jgi:hypothetical protein
MGRREVRHVTEYELVPAHDPYQVSALIVIHLTLPQPFGHRASLDDQHPWKTPGWVKVTCD